MPIDLNDQPRRRRAGAILVLLGLAIFILQYVEDAAESVIFFGIGAIFLFFYLRQQRFGFLVPGSILIGIGLGMIFENAGLEVANPSSLGLAIGFLMIYGIERLSRGSARWWPLVPGGLMLFGALRGGQTWGNRVFAEGWPLLLVALGVLVYLGKLGWGRAGAGSRTPAAEPEADDDAS